MKNLILIAAVILIVRCSPKTDPESKAIEIPQDLTELGLMLDSILVEDQRYRIEIEGLLNEFGWESEEMKTLWAKIAKVDSCNLEVVEEILAIHGWIGPDKIGVNPNSTLFYVIQHSNQKTQEKYLPMMRNAVEEENAKARNLALLEDRVALGKGELQIYGSQIDIVEETGEYFVSPLFDPENVNQRRAKVGLGTIEEYIAFWNLKWDVEAYKQQLPTWIEQQKKKLNIIVK